MNFSRITLTIIFMLSFVCTIHSQESRTEFFIDFRLGSSVIDTLYSDNADNLRHINDFIDTATKDSTFRILQVAFCGSTSLEGSDQINQKLAYERLSALENFVRSKMHIADSMIVRNNSYIPWSYLKMLVEKSDISYKQEVISILDDESQLVNYYPGSQIDNRILKLKKLYEGKVWNQINSLFFRQMRNASVIFLTYNAISDIDEEDLPTMNVPFDSIDVNVTEYPELTLKTPVLEQSSDNPVQAPVHTDFVRQVHLKTNALGWAIGVTNLGVEFDIAKHFSIGLPIYYSGWNYFKSTIKFRTFAIQPEFRYWIKSNNNGFFTGVHFGMAYYNLAGKGQYRYQDHNRETPALGGGLSVGYRLPISKNNRWRVEFSLGAGVYSIHYDKFRNTRDTKHGLLVESVKKTYWGLDQASVSFSYSFDLKKKGGRR